MRLSHRHALVTPGVLGAEQLLSPLLDVAEKDEKASERERMQSGRGMLGERGDGAALHKAEDSLLEEAPSEMSALEESSSSEDLSSLSRSLSRSRDDLVQEQEQLRATAKRRSAFRAVLAPLIHFCRQQVELTLSGENASPHLQIKFSPIVAASSLLYIPVSLSFFAAGQQPMGTVMGAITVTSLYSDSLDPTSKFWSRLDRFLCTMGAVLGPVKAIVLASSVSKRVQVIVVCGGSLGLLAWSRQSKTQKEFVLRHTLWHVVSAVALTWLTFAVSLGR